MAPRKKSVRVAVPMRSVQVPMMEDDSLSSTDGEQAETVTEAVRVKEQANEQQREPKARIKVIHADGKSQYLDTALLELVNEDWLAENYGGGKFTVFKEGQREDGTWGYIGHSTFDIDSTLPFKGSIRKQLLDKMEADKQNEMWESRASLHNADGSAVPRQPQGNPLVDTAIFNLLKSHQDNAQASNQFFLTMMEQMRQSSQTSQAMLMQMMEKNTGGGGMEKMMPLLLAIAPKVLEMVATKRDNTIETLLPLLEQMRPKDEGQKLEDVLSLVGKLKDAGLMGEGGESGGGWMGMMGKALEALAPALVQAQRSPLPPQYQPQSAMPMPSATTPALPSPASSGDEVTIESAEDVWRVIGERIEQVRLMAAMGRRAERIALMVVEFASPPQLALLTEVLADPRFEDQFLERFPQMRTYSRWTAEFIGVMRDELLGLPDDDEEEEEKKEIVAAPVVVTPAAPSTGKKK
jgi:hypothetical protein